MPTPVVDKSLADNYRNFYRDKDVAAWRKVGAVNKVGNITALCEQYPKNKVLEIGSGDGAILQRLDDVGFGDQLFALEISESGIETIKRRKIKNLVACDIYNGYDIPYPDQTFDLVILSHVVEHLEYPRKLLKEAARVGKYVLIEVPLEDNLLLKENFKWNATGHINFYAKKTIRQLIQSCEIDIVDHRISDSSLEVYRFTWGKLGWFVYWVKKILLQLMPRPALFLLTYNYSLLCRKCNPT